MCDFIMEYTNRTIDTIDTIVCHQVQYDPADNRFRIREFCLEKNIKFKFTDS